MTHELAHGVPWTGIGSLPFEEPEVAMAHVLAAYPAMPFLPELARPGGGLLTAALPASLPRSEHAGYGVKLRGLGAETTVVEAFDPHHGLDAPLLHDLDRLRLHLPELDDAVTLKFQLAGPVTLLQGVRDAGSNPLWVYPELHAIAARWIAALASEAAKRLLEHHEPVTVWLDEPMLGLPGVDASSPEIVSLLEPALETLTDLEIRTGLHCCGEPPLGLSGAVRLDYLSIDALRYEAELIAGAPRLVEAIERGATLALGVARTLPLGADEPPGPLVRRLRSALAATSPRAAARLPRQLLLTPCCGTLLAPVTREREIAALLRDWSTDPALEDG